MLRPALGIALLAATVGTASLVAAAPALAAGTPPPPGNLHVTATTDTSADLQWTASTDPRVNHYYIYLDGQLRNVQPGTATHLTPSSLAPSTSYAFTVRAVIDPDDYLDNGNAVLSAPSNTASATTKPDVTPPGAPSLSVSRTTHTSVTLSWWTQVDNDFVHKVSFALTDGDTTVHVTPDPGQATYTFTGLQPDVAYTFTARATDADGNVGPLSAPVTATTPEDVPPSTPTGLTFDAATKVLSWQPSTDNRTPDQLKYQLFANGQPVQLLLFWPGYTSADLQLEIDCGTFVPNGSYTVRAVDAAGNVSGMSNAVDVQIW